MADNTRIAWCDATWSPFRGCSRVSPGCSRCYAERMCSRGLPGLKSPTTGEDFAVKMASGPRWTGRVELIEDALEIPLRWRKPRRIFVNSMSDTFHESVPDEWIDRVFAVMALCPQHTFIVCTKRTKRARAYLSDDRLKDMLTDLWAEAQPDREPGSLLLPLPNVILLASVEDQPRADERIPDLLATPAAVRGISLEPMLGPADLRRWMVPKSVKDGYAEVQSRFPSSEPTPAHLRLRPSLDWIIVGGESGPGARPCNIDWIRDVVRQCREAGVACFVKQLGALPTLPTLANWRGPEEGKPFMWSTDLQAWRVRLSDRAGADPAEWPSDLQVQQWPEVRRG